MNRQTNQPNTQPYETNPPLFAETAVTQTAASFEQNIQMTATRDERQLSFSGDDELLSSLSNAYENRRARQVFEWETIRRRAESNAPSYNFA